MNVLYVRYCGAEQCWSIVHVGMLEDELYCEFVFSGSVTIILCMCMVKKAQDVGMV